MTIEINQQLIDTICTHVLAACGGALLCILLLAFTLERKAADAPPPVCRPACCGGHATNEAGQSAKTVPATAKTSRL